MPEEPEEFNPGEAYATLLGNTDFQKLSPEDKQETIDNYTNSHVMRGRDFNGEWPSNKDIDFWSRVSKTRAFARLNARHGTDALMQELTTLSEGSTLNDLSEPFRVGESGADMAVWGSGSPTEEGIDGEDFRVGERSDDLLSLRALPHPTRNIIHVNDHVNKPFMAEFDSKAEIPQNGEDWVHYLANNHAEEMGVNSGFVYDQFKTGRLGLRKMAQEFSKFGPNMSFMADTAALAAFTTDEADQAMIQYNVLDTGRLVPSTKEEQDALKIRALEQINKRKSLLPSPLSGQNFSPDKPVTDRDILAEAVQIHLNDMRGTDVAVGDEFPSFYPAKKGDVVDKSSVLQAYGVQFSPMKGDAMLSMFKEHSELVQVINDKFGQTLSEKIWKEREGAMQNVRNFTIDALGMTGQVLPMTALALTGQGGPALGMGALQGYSGHFSETFTETFHDNVSGGLSISEALDNAVKAASSSSAIAGTVDLAGDVVMVKFLKRFSDLLKGTPISTQKLTAKGAASIMQKAAGGRAFVGETGRQALKQSIIQLVSEASGELVRAEIGETFEVNQEGFRESAKGALYEGLLAMTNMAGTAAVQTSSMHLLSEYQYAKAGNMPFTGENEALAFQIIPRNQQIQILEADLANVKKELENIPSHQRKKAKVKGPVSNPDDAPAPELTPVAAAKQHSVPEYMAVVPSDGLQKQILAAINPDINVGDVIVVDESSSPVRIMSIEAKLDGVVGTGMTPQGETVPLDIKALENAETRIANTEFTALATPRDKSAFNRSQEEAAPTAPVEVAAEEELDPFKTGEIQGQGDTFAYLDLSLVPAAPNSGAVSYTSNVQFALGAAPKAGLRVTGPAKPLGRALNESGASTNAAVRAAVEAIGPEGMTSIPVMRVDGDVQGAYTVMSRGAEGDQSTFEAIFLSQHTLESSARTTGTLGHEVIHAATRRGIALAEGGNAAAAKALEGIDQVFAGLETAILEFDSATEDVSPLLRSALRQISKPTQPQAEELLTHSQTNPEFQRWLRARDLNGKVISTSKPSTSQSMWQWVANAVKKLLNLGKSNKTDIKKVENAVDKLYGLSSELFEIVRDSRINGRTYESVETATQAAEKMGLEEGDYKIAPDGDRHALFVKAEVSDIITPEEMAVVQTMLSEKVYSDRPSVPLPTRKPTSMKVPAVLDDLYGRHKDKINELTSQGLVVYAQGIQTFPKWTSAMESIWGDALDWSKVWDDMQVILNDATAARKASNTSPPPLWAKGRGNKRYNAALLARAAGSKGTTVRDESSFFIDEEGTAFPIVQEKKGRTTLLHNFHAQLLKRARTKLHPKALKALDQYGAEGNLPLLSFDNNAANQNYFTFDAVTAAEEREASIYEPWRFNQLSEMPMIVESLNERHHQVRSAFGQLGRMFQDEATSMGVHPTESRAIYNAATKDFNYKTEDAEINALLKDYRKVYMSIGRLAPMKREKQLRKARSAAFEEFRGISKDDGFRGGEYYMYAFGTTMTNTGEGEVDPNNTFASDVNRYYNVDAIRHSEDSFQMVRRLFGIRQMKVPRINGFTSLQLQGNEFDATREYDNNFIFGMRTALIDNAMSGSIPMVALRRLLRGDTLSEAHSEGRSDLVDRNFFEAFIVPTIDSLAVMAEDFGSEFRPPEGTIDNIKARMEKAYDAIIAGQGKQKTSMDAIIGDELRYSRNSTQLKTHFDTSMFDYEEGGSESLTSFGSIYNEYIRSINSGGMLRRIDNTNESIDVRTMEGRDEVKDGEKDLVRDTDYKFRKDFKRLQARAIHALAGKDQKRAYALASGLLIQAASLPGAVEENLQEVIKTHLSRAAFSQSQRNTAPVFESAIKTVAEQTGMDPVKLGKQIELAGGQMGTAVDLATFLQDEVSTASSLISEFLATNMPRIPTIFVDSRNIELGLQGADRLLNETGVAKFSNPSANHSFNETVYVADLAALSNRATEFTNRNASATGGASSALVAFLGEMLAGSVDTSAATAQTVENVNNLQSVLDAQIESGFEATVEAEPQLAGLIARMTEALKERQEEAGSFSAMDAGVFALSVLTDPVLRHALQAVHPSASMGYIIPEQTDEIITKILHSDVGNVGVQFGDFLNMDASNSGVGLVYSKTTGDHTDVVNGGAKSFTQLEIDSDGNAWEVGTESTDSLTYAKDVIWQSMKLIGGAFENQFNLREAGAPIPTHEPTHSSVSTSALEMDADAHAEAQRNSARMAEESQERRDEAEEIFEGTHPLAHDAAATIQEMGEQQANLAAHLPTQEPEPGSDPTVVRNDPPNPDEDTRILEMATATSSPASTNPFHNSKAIVADPELRRAAAVDAAWEIWDGPRIPDYVRNAVEASEESFTFAKNNPIQQLIDIAERLLEPRGTAAYKAKLRSRAMSFAKIDNNIKGVNTTGDLRWHRLFDAWREMMSWKLARNFNDGAKGLMHGGRGDNHETWSMRALMDNDSIVQWYGAKSPKAVAKLVDLMMIPEYGVNERQGFTAFKADMAKQTEILDQLAGNMTQEDFSLIQMVGLLGTRPVGKSESDTIMKTWSDILIGHANLEFVKAREVGLGQKKQFKVHQRTIDNLRPFIETYLAAAATGMGNYAGLQSHLWALLKPEAQRFVTYYRKKFAEQRPALEIAARYYGKTGEEGKDGHMGIIDNWWPMMGRRKGQVITQLYDDKYREPYGKVGSSQAKNQNRRNDDSEGEYVSNHDGLAAIRQTLSTNSFMLNTVSSFMLMHDLIGSNGKNSVAFDGQIVSMLKGTTVPGTLSTLNENTAAVKNTMQGMRMVFDRTRSSFQQTGVVDTRSRRATQQLAQIGAFYALADVEQIFKQTLPGMAVYSLRAMANPKKFANLMSVMKEGSLFNPAITDFIARSAPAIHERGGGADGVASLHEKFAKEIEKLGNREDWAGMYQGVKNGSKHSKAMIQNHFTRMLSWTTGMPDGLLSKHIYLSEYLTETGMTMAQVTANPDAFNAKAARKAQRLTEEVMAQSEQSRRGELLQSGTNNMDEIKKTMIRSFGNHSVSMWAHAQSQWKSIQKGNVKDWPQAIGKIFELTLQNFVFRSMTKAIRDYLVASIVANLGNWEDDERDKLYRELLDDGLLGQLGYDMEFPGIKNPGLERGVQPIESMADLRSRYGWRALMDNTMILPGPAGGLLTLPVVNDAFTEALTYVMESKVIQSDQKTYNKTPDEQLLAAAGYLGVPIGEWGKYVEKEELNAGTAARMAAMVLMLRGMRGRMLQNMRSEKPNPYEGLLN